MSKYYRGFVPVSNTCYDAIVHMPVAASITFVKGQALFDNGSGYITNVGTAFADTFKGIAATDLASQTSNGDAEIPVILPLPNIRWRVPNLSATQIAQTDVGELCDLEADPTNTSSSQGIDVTDTTIAAAAGWAFVPEEIDISTDALANDGVAASGGGFCIGRFVSRVSS